MPDVRLVDSRADVAAEPEVLLVGWPAATADLIVGRLRTRGIAARTTGVLSKRVMHTVVVFGPEVSAMDAAKVIEESLDRTCVVLGLAAGNDAASFQPLVDDDRMFFLAKEPPPLDETLELVHAAWKRASVSSDDDNDDGRDSRILELLRRLTREHDLGSALRAIEQEACVIADAERAQIWIVDARNDRLVAGEREESAVAGVTSYVARTGRGIAVEHLEDDPRYDVDLDAAVDNADARDRFLAWPIGDEERVYAVLTLRRSSRSQPFTHEEQGRVARMAKLVAPIVARFVLDRELDARAAERHSAIRDDVAQLFRGEALEQYHRGRTDEAHLLEIEPIWTRHAYRVLIALLFAAFVFAFVVWVDRFADGIGIVRNGRLTAVLDARNRTELRPQLALQFAHTDVPLTVLSVERTIIAAADARRILGEDGARLWTTSEPALRIDAALPINANLGDGVTGRVRVRLGRERLLFALIPVLRGTRG